MRRTLAPCPGRLQPSPAEPTASFADSALDDRTELTCGSVAHDDILVQKLKPLLSTGATLSQYASIPGDDAGPGCRRK
jgi:hypothetical protein